MSTKPNLVFLHNDHQALYQWRDYPVKPLRPNFDRVARGGIAFQNAYCSSPLCGPARRTLLTGVYPHTHKQFYNTSEEPYEQTPYLDLLGDAGYENYYFGKWHAGPGDALDHQCRGLTQNYYGNPYLWEDYQAYLKEKGLPPATFLIEHVLGASHWGYGQPDSPYYDLVKGNDSYRCKDPSWCGEHAAGTLLSPRESHECFYLASRACDAIRTLAARPGDGAPFSLRVDFWGPHQPYFPAREYLDLYADMPLPEYPSWNSRLEGKPDCYHRERNRPMGKDNRLIIPHARPWSYYQDLLRHCAAQITMLDAAAGLVLDALEESGLLENTLVIYSTDHGDALACHGGHFDKASYMPQELLRIPLAMMWKGHIPPGQTSDALVSSVSTPVTLLDAAGLQFPHKTHARSLLPLAQGRQAPPDYVVAESRGHGFGEEIPSRVIVKGRYKYVSYDDPDNVDELYHLDSDPYELQNLAEDARYADIRLDLRQTLLRWQAETDDTVIFPWAGRPEA